jgi:hypothetical protein
MFELASEFSSIDLAVCDIPYLIFGDFWFQILGSDIGSILLKKFIVIGSAKVTS